jgi:hypothetical protein
MEEPISETVSKKGRPPKFPPQVRAYLTKLFRDEVRTERGRLNICYRQRALKAIWAAKDPKLNWLGEREKMAAGTGRMKGTILIELGKIDDEQELIAVAKEICALKPNSKDGVRRIRRYRLGERTGNSVDLANEILRTLNDYRKQFPKTTPQEVLEALAYAERQVRKAKR